MITQSQNAIQVNDAPLTAALSAANSPLLTSDVDSRIIKIRPMATPIDQLSRCGEIRHAGSMTVRYYQADVKDTSSALSEAPIDSDATENASGQIVLKLKPAKPKIFSLSETVLLPDVQVGDDPMVLYLTEVTDSYIKGTVINSGFSADDIDLIESGAKVVRMGRAAAELDVQTPQFETIPKREENFCQIFKMQVEESMLHRLSNKEVEWNFSDQEEIAIIDMRQGMEKNFIFGQKAKLTGDKNDEIYFTGGIWNQGLPTVQYKKSALTEATLVSWCRTAFTGQGGAARKILIGGSEFVEALSNMQHDRVLFNGATFVRWGLEFNEIKTNFGTLYLIHSEIFDQCGHSADAMIIDPQMLTKYVHIPFTTEKLDLRASGQRNTDAVVITEASCVVLRNPAAHLRIVASTSNA